MASGVVNNTNILTHKRLYNVALADILIPGVYLGVDGISDSPDGVNGHLIVIGSGINFTMCKQIWIPYRTPGSNDNHVYIRGYSNGWGNWVKYEGVFVT